MTRSIKLIILAITCSSVVYLGFLLEKPHESTEQVSGAFESLSFFGASRTYPLQQLPERAHFAAWKKAQQMSEAAHPNRSAVEPWETMGPHNRGGRTLALAFNPQNPLTMYAGSASGGLWRSYTAGIGENAWHQVETGFPVLAVSTIKFAPGDSSTLYIGTGEVYNVNAAGTGAAYRSTRGSYGMGILRSTDGGATWEQSLDMTYDQNKGIWDIEIAPSNPNIIYAGTTDGVYKSTDGGTNWNWVLDVPMANDLVVHPSDPNKVVVGCGNFASPGFGIYRTSDGGVFWYKMTDNLPTFYEGKIQLALAPSQPDIVYASIGNGFSSANGASWLCRSNDFGANWQIRNTTDYSQWQGWFSHDVAVSPTNPDEITVIGIEVWRSSDGGLTLTKKSTGGVGFANPTIAGPDGNSDYVHSDIHDVIYHPILPNTFYVASDGGIHRSDDHGETYYSCNGRYQTAQFYNGFTNSMQDPNFCQGGLQDNGTIQWNGAGGGGVTWTRVSGGDGSWTATDPTNDDVNYVSSQNLNVRKTTTGSSGYAGLGIPTMGNISFIAPYVLAPSNGNVLYAGSAAIAKSTDGGSSWALTNSGNVLDGNPALSMSMSSQNTEVVYVGTAPSVAGSPGGIYVTQNGGTSWADVTANLPNRYPMDIQVDPTDDAIAYVAFSGYGTGHVYRTTDHGATWEDISQGLPDVPANAIEVDPLFPNNVYVGNDLGVFVSSDFGLTWQTYQDGLGEAVMVFDLKISPSNRKLRAATHGLGAFQRDLLEAPLVSAVVSPSANNPLQVSIFPNPASTAATIRYELFENQQISLNLLDARGILVAQIFSGKKAAGKHEASVPLSGFPKGIYFVKCEIGKQGAMQRLLVE